MVVMSLEYITTTITIIIITTINLPGSSDKGEGEGGVWMPPKNDDVIYEQPLTSVKLQKTAYSHWSRAGLL